MYGQLMESRKMEDFNRSPVIQVILSKWPGGLRWWVEGEVQCLTLAFGAPLHVAVIHVFGPQVSLDPTSIPSSV